MPYALVTIGLLLIITGINNTYSQFASQLQSDFTGQKSFVVWIIALGSVGALGYIRDLQQFSHYFMALILIAFVLSNKGVFAKFQQAVAAGPTTPSAPITGAVTNGGSSSTNALPQVTITPLGSTQQSSQSTSNIESALPGISGLTNFLLNPGGGQ